jgi:hypothetical protein
MIEVLHHQLDDLRLVIDVVALGRGLSVTLGCFELNDTSVSLLPLISHDFVDICGQRCYFERAMLESGLEVVGLTGEDDFV